MVIGRSTLTYYLHVGTVGGCGCLIPTIFLSRLISKALWVGHGLAGGVGPGLVGHGIVGGVGLAGIGHGVVGHGFGHGLVGSVGHSIGHGVVSQGVGHGLVGSVGHGIGHGVVGHGISQGNGHSAAHGVHGVYGEPIPYTYQYAVAEALSGSHFSASKTGDGTAARQGSYSVALPDGRTQTVN